MNALLDDFKQKQPIMSRLEDVALASNNRTLVVLKEINLPAGMRGMTRLSDDIVVIGYGRGMPGADAFSVTGKKRIYLQGIVGLVCDIAIMRNKDIVVSHGNDVIQVYNKGGFPTDFQFYSQEKGENYKICASRMDEVFAVNRTSSIYVFRQGKDTPTRVIPIGIQSASQISVTRSGTLIARSYNAHIIHKNVVTLYDKFGKRGSSIISNQRT